MPEAVRRAENEYRRLKTKGLPVPEAVRAGHLEYGRLCRRARGVKPAPPKRTDIPEELRAANSEYGRLWKAGLPVPDEIAEARREYSKMCSCRGGGPRGRRPVHGGIPEELRAANSEYHRLHRLGEPVPDEIQAGMNEYHRLCREARRREAA